MINDPFAEPLVRAVGLDLFTKMMDGELDMSTIADVSPAVAQAMVYGNAVRTKYFDDYLITPPLGIRQVAILASGWTPGPTGCRGRPGRWYTRSTNQK